MNLTTHLLRLPAIFTMFSVVLYGFSVGSIMRKSFDEIGNVVTVGFWVSSFDFSFDEV